MKILFIGGIRDGKRLEVDKDILFVSFSDSSKASKYEKIEIVVSISGTGKSVDVMVSEDTPHMEALNRFLKYK